MAEVKRRSLFRIWGDVVFAIFIRQIRSKFNDKLGLSWALIEPLSFILLLSYGRSALSGGEDTHNMPTFVFMMYGMLFVQLFLAVLGSTAGSIKRNKPLYAFRQVQPIASVVASMLEEGLVKLFVYGIILVFMYFMFIEIRVDDALLLICCFFLLLLMSASLGLLFGIGELYLDEIKKVRQVVTRPIFFISGVFFSLQDVPQEFWPYLNWNPVLHAIELSRDAAHSNFGAKGVSITFLGISSLCSAFLALCCYSVFWKAGVSR